MGLGGCRSLVAGGVALAAAERHPDDAAGEGHVQAVRLSVQVQRQDTSVVLAVRGAPATKRRPRREQWSDQTLEPQQDQNPGALRPCESATGAGRGSPDVLGPVEDVNLLQ